jgi:hypothetical protein
LVAPLKLWQKAEGFASTQNAVTLRLKAIENGKYFDINNLVRENVKTMTYSSARDEFKDFDVAQMIFLDANENPSNEVNRYPDPTKQC